MKKLFTACALSRIVRLAILLGITQSAFHAYGHGGVAFEDDLCVINVNFMQAHFTCFSRKPGKTLNIAKTSRM